MPRIALLMIVAIATLVIAPLSGYSGAVNLKPDSADATGTKGWGEEVRENAREEEGKERREDRRDERQERREDIFD